jgi:hypothetical protein
MTSDAEKHLNKAERLLAKGDGFYAQAADEIIAAQKADTTLGNREIGKRFGRSESWVRKLVAWRTSASSSPTPYGGEADAINVRKTKQLLREAPLEQVEQMISELPKDRQTAIRGALGDGYAQARQAEDERVKNQTPAERKEIEAAKEAIGEPVRKAVASFTALGVVGHLEQATEDLEQMIADQAVTPESIYRITQAHDRFVTELEVARAMAGLEERSEA